MTNHVNNGLGSKQMVLRRNSTKSQISEMILITISHQEEANQNHIEISSQFSQIGYYPTTWETWKNFLAPCGNQGENQMMQFLSSLFASLSSSH